MLTKKTFASITVVLILISQLYGQLQGGTADSTVASLFAMSLEELLNVKVTVASKKKVKASDAPSVISVITSQEIEAMGARDFNEILRFIPGFEFSRRVDGGDGLGFRGVKDPRFNHRYLLMVNGIPFNQIFYGIFMFNGFTGININSIERIEIIRGPGSALYGRNAFSAVINVITKTAKTSSLLSGKAEYGNFNTLNGHASFAKEIAPGKGFYVDVGHANSDVTEETTINAITGTAGSWNENYENTTLLFNGHLDNLSFNTMLFSSYWGTSSNEDSYAEDQFVYYNVKYDFSKIDKHDVKLNVFGHNGKHVENLLIITPNDPALDFPATDTTSAFNFYPNGLLARPSFTEYIYGIEVEDEVHLDEKNTLLAGIQFDYRGIKDAKFESNADFYANSPLPLPIAGATKDKPVEDPRGWLTSSSISFTNLAFYAQNIWIPGEKWSITYGGRYDLDSQIGGVFNPRVGVSYAVTDKLTAKVLYGQAYRAPTLSEQHQTIGYANGNLNLKPERIKTYELALNYNSAQSNTQLNFFFNQIKDLIYSEADISVDVSNLLQNLGDNTAKGVEFEHKFKLQDRIIGFINYSFTSSKTTTNGEDKFTYKAVDISPHKVNVGVNVRLPYHLGLNTNLLYRSKMKKFTTEDSNNTRFEVSQDKVGNYFIANAKLRFDNPNTRLKLGLSTYNLFNTFYYMQESGRARHPRMPGFTWLVSVQYVFKEN